MGMIRPRDVYPGWSKASMLLWLKWKKLRPVGFRRPGYGEKYVYSRVTSGGVGIIDTLVNYCKNYEKTWLIVESVK